MKLTFNYGSRAMVLPGAVLEKIDKASKKDIKLLLVLASDASLLGEGMTEELMLITGLKREEIESSLAFWRGAGIIEFDGEELSDKRASAPIKKTARAEEQKKEKKLRSEDSLPRYTTEELNALLEKREEYSFLIGECQQLFGKIFNPAEINIVVALTDYLGLDSEYILLLFAHLGKQEHKSVRMAEKMAHRFLDEDITDAETLGERLRFLEAAEETERKVRAVFGINSRALTKKEKALIEKWLSEYHYDFEMIEKAYEMTVDSTGKPSLPYAGAIMDRWFSEGIRTVADAEQNIEDHKKSKASAGGSFDTDEFLEAALKRSFEGS
ncbi:MAG: DnaD domain protein [Clostridia bacterium]|nr:DnaD domain protein [Clostridia bacterium]